MLYISVFFIPLLKKKVILFCTGWSVCRPIDVGSISFNPCARKLPNLVQWMPLESIWPLLMFRHMVKGQGQNAGLWMSLDHFGGNLLNLVQWMPLDSRWPLLMFRSHGLRSRSNIWSLKKCCLFTISITSIAWWLLNFEQWFPP